MKKILKSQFLLFILVTQIIFPQSIVKAEFRKIEKDAVLQVTGEGQVARRNGVNFRKHYKKNRAFGSESELPLGSKVRYTGKSRRLRSGNFGIQVELLSGVDKDLIGKRVWLHYRNRKPTIAEIDESKDTSIFNEADVTNAEDLIEPNEDPNEFFVKHVPSADSVALRQALDEADGVLQWPASKVSPDSACTEATCLNPTERSPFSSEVLAEELNKAGLSVSAQKFIKDSGIPQTPLLRALQYFNKNKMAKKINLNTLVIADLTQSADKKRMFKIDLKTGKVVKFTTSHGRGYSNSRTCAHAFGNRANSYLSSGGAYLTGNMRSFKGEHALTLIGAEKGKNNNAFSRGILFHRASYVSDSHAGRTLGCLSIADKYAEKFITEIQGHDGIATRSDRKKGRSPAPEQHTEIYVYPDRDDLLDRNAYWDSSCKSELERKGREPKWIN